MKRLVISTGVKLLVVLSICFYGESKASDSLSDLKKMKVMKVVAKELWEDGIDERSKEQVPKSTTKSPKKIILPEELELALRMLST